MRVSDCQDITFLLNPYFSDANSKTQISLRNYVFGASLFVHAQRYVFRDLVQFIVNISHGATTSDFALP